MVVEIDDELLAIVYLIVIMLEGVGRLEFDAKLIVGVFTKLRDEIDEFDISDMVDEVEVPRNMIVIDIDLMVVELTCLVIVLRLVEMPKIVDDEVEVRFIEVVVSETDEIE